jgi:hypothetical protein
MKLYSYCLRYDGGSAPNPFWGTCTLVICKPAIRRTAQIGDWVAGLGSANSPIGDISTCVVYAMKVTGKMTLKQYDRFCQAHLPGKLPQRHSQDSRLQNGDCIYDYSGGEYPVVRPAVHNECHREHDLGGKYALLSTHFYYFGSQPVSLPEYLHPIIHRTQGHKSHQNQPYAQIFVDWIEGLEYKKNWLHATPQYTVKHLRDVDLDRTCSTGRPQPKDIKRLSRTC